MVFGISALFALSAWLGFALRTRSLNSLVPYLLVSALTVSATYFCIGAKVPPEWYSVLITILAGVLAGFSIISIMNKFNFKMSQRLVRVARAKLVMDFRLYSALAGLLVAYFLTFYFANKGMNENPKAFWFNFYISWISGLLLFTVVGLVMGFVSLYKPENDVFEARVKILVGGRSDGAIKYLIDELKNIGYAAKSASREIVLEQYDEGRKAFRLRISHKAVLENIYHDVVTDASGSLTLKPDNFSPPINEVGRVISLRVDGVSLLNESEIVTELGYKKEWSKQIPSGGEIPLEYDYVCWHSGMEVHQYAPIRFTASLETRFVSRCDMKDKNICIISTIGGISSSTNLKYDEYHTIANLQNIAPLQNAYTFKIEVV